MAHIGRERSFIDCRNVAGLGDCPIGNPESDAPLDAQAIQVAGGRTLTLWWVRVSVVWFDSLIDQGLPTQVQGLLNLFGTSQLRQGRD